MRRDPRVGLDTRLIKQRMDAGYASNPTRSGQMYDELTVGTVIDPTLVKSKDMYVERVTKK